MGVTPIYLFIFLNLKIDLQFSTHHCKHCDALCRKPPPQSDVMLLVQHRLDALVQNKGHHLESIVTDVLDMCTVYSYQLFGLVGRLSVLRLGGQGLISLGHTKDCKIGLWRHVDIIDIIDYVNTSIDAYSVLCPGGFLMPPCLRFSMYARGRAGSSHNRAMPPNLSCCKHMYIQIYSFDVVILT